jgi:hypothetical protein
MKTELWNDFVDKAYKWLSSRYDYMDALTNSEIERQSRQVPYWDAVEAVLALMQRAEKAMHFARYELDVAADAYYKFKEKELINKIANAAHVWFETEYDIAYAVEWRDAWAKVSKAIDAYNLRGRNDIND